MTAILSSPNRLFLSLCRAHRIAWSDRWLLWRLAASQRLEDPARVFLEPERLDPDAAGPFSARRAARLERLQRKLFDEVLSTRCPEPNAEACGAGKEARPHR